jgi:hypothetical protein
VEFFVDTAPGHEKPRKTPPAAETHHTTTEETPTHKNILNKKSD